MYVIRVLLLLFAVFFIISYYYKGYLIFSLILFTFFIITIIKKHRNIELYNDSFINEYDEGILFKNFKYCIIKDRRYNNITSLRYLSLRTNKLVSINSYVYGVKVLNKLFEYHNKYITNKRPISL